MESCDIEQLAIVGEDWADSVVPGDQRFAPPGRIVKVGKRDLESVAREALEAEFQLIVLIVDEESRLEAYAGLSVELRRSLRVHFIDLQAEPELVESFLRYPSAESREQFETDEALWAVYRRRCGMQESLGLTSVTDLRAAESTRLEETFYLAAASTAGRARERSPFETKGGDFQLSLRPKAEPNSSGGSLTVVLVDETKVDEYEGALATLLDSDGKQIGLQCDGEIVREQTVYSGKAKWVFDDWDAAMEKLFPTPTVCIDKEWGESAGD